MNIKDLQGKILVSIVRSDNTVVEKLVRINDSSITVDNITYPIQTQNAFKAVEIEDGVYIPAISLFRGEIIGGRIQSKGIAITNDNLHFRFWRLKRGNK